jgi:hypothetical protein
MEEKKNSMPLNELQSKLKKRFPQLSESDLQLLHHAGKREMLQMIGYKLRKTKDQMLHIIKTL